MSLWTWCAIGGVLWLLLFGFGPPAFRIAESVLVMGWHARQARRRVMARRQAELRALAAALHGSNAWDCGCWEHVAERARAHGDIRGMGLLARRRRLLGFIPYEVVHLSKEQKQELSDD